MATKARRHIHKYHRVALSYTNVWACALSDCTHYMPNTLENLVIGKKSICWKCEQPFIFDIESMKLDKPICSNCRLNVPEDETDIPVSDVLLAHLNKAH